MKKFDLSALKNKLETKKSNTQRQNYSSERFSFWNMNDDEEAIIRFLPDKDEDNPWFLHEYKFHEVYIDGKKRSVNCAKNYGDKEKCPLCDKSQEYYGKGDDANGKKWYRKISWLAQVVVMKDPLAPDPETGLKADGEYRTVALSRQVYDALINSIKDDMDDDAPLPQDFDNGRNFIIKKQTNKVNLNGRLVDQADYRRSKFDRKETALSDEIIEKVSEKIVLLSSLMPQRPEMDYLYEMVDKASGKKSYSDDEDDFKPTIKTVSSVKAKMFDVDDDVEFNIPERSSKISNAAALFTDDEINEFPDTSVKSSRLAEIDDEDDDPDTAALMKRANERKRKLAESILD